MGFDEMYDDGRVSLDELLAKGEYESSSSDILAGFKIFQKKYVYKGVVFQMILVLLGAASQIVNIMGAAPGEDVMFSYTLILVCIILGVYIIVRPRGTYKRLEKSISDLDGTAYRAEFYTNKIVISNLSNEYNDAGETDKPENVPEKLSENEAGQSEGETETEDETPATVIHLDNSSVEIVETDKLYVVYIKRVNVFVIPKAAFKPYENTQIKDRLSNIMGVRYKC